MSVTREFTTRSTSNLAKDLMPGLEEQSLRLGRKGKMSRPPWEDMYGKVIWPSTRIRAYKLAESQSFEFAMGMLILFNFFLIILETDYTALCHPLEGRDLKDCEHYQVMWLWIVNLGLLCIYTAEAVMRVFAERDRYIFNHWNKLDLFVVVAGWIAEVTSSMHGVSFLRVFRTARLLRVMRILISFRELYLLVSGMVSAFKTLTFSTIILFFLLTFWAILLVEYVHPINSSISYPTACPGCNDAYNSVMRAVLTLFQQVVTGDNWGQVSVPVILEQPGTAVLLVAVVITVSLGLMNLILAVIVERAQDARERDRAQKAKQKEDECLQQKMELMEFCKKMDEDESGELTLAELLSAYEEIPAFRQLLAVMDIQKDELQSVFKLLDKDRSGDVSYDEFCDELHKIRTRDTRTMLTFLKLNLNDLHDKIDANQKTVEAFIKEQSQNTDKIMKHMGADQAAPQHQNKATDTTGKLDQNASRVGKMQALSKEARDLAGLKSNLVTRVEEQTQTLVNHAEFLGALASNTGSASLPTAEKVQRVDEKLGRLHQNLRDAERWMEDTTAALARNRDLLSGLGKELDYQPKQRQARPHEGGVAGVLSPGRTTSSQVGEPPLKLELVVGDSGTALTPPPDAHAGQPAYQPAAHCIAPDVWPPQRKVNRGPRPMGAEGCLGCTMMPPPTSAPGIGQHSNV